MMRVVVTLFIVVLLAGAAQAQRVAVRGGEHPGFTRLVLDLPEAMPWEISREGDRATIALQRDLSFDLSDAFTRLSEDRVAGLMSGPDAGELSLRLGCACQLQSFLHDGRMLVIDIRDSAEVPPAPRAAALPLLPARRDQGKLPDGVAFPGARSVLAPAERRLAQALGRAASQAILVPSGSAANGAGGVLPGLPTPGGTGDENVSQLALRGPFQAAPPDAAQNPAAGPGGLDCVPDRLLEVASWSDGTPFPDQLGRLRTSLYDEIDRPAPEVAAALAQLLVHMGFGAESRTVLPLARDALSDRNARTLTSMAEILDRVGLPAPDDRARRTPEVEPAFAGQTGCAGKAALWAVLEPGTLPPGTPIDVAALRRAFQALPLHLRRHLAPELAARLRATGQGETAAAILQAVTRLTPEAPPALALARAEEALSEGRPDAAEPILAELAAGGGDVGPLALAALIEARAAVGQPIEPQTVALVAGHAREYRDQSIGPRIRRAHVLALAGADELDAALEEVAGFDRAGLPYDRPGTLGPLWTAIAAATDDPAFLRRALEADAAPDGLPESAARAVAARLLALGLPDASLAWLAGPDAGGARHRLLRAEAALALGRPGEAEALLSGLQSRRADRLLAQARADQGDHAAAAQLFESVGQTDAAARHRFLASGPDEEAAEAPPPPAGAPDARQAATESDPAEVAVPVAVTASDETEDEAAEAGPAQRASGPPDRGAMHPSTGVLARNRALLEQSAATREALTDLLTRVEGPRATR